MVSSCKREPRAKKCSTYFDRKQKSPKCLARLACLAPPTAELNPAAPNSSIISQSARLDGTTLEDWSSRLRSEVSGREGRQESDYDRSSEQNQVNLIPASTKKRSSRIEMGQLRRLTSGAHMSLLLLGCLISGSALAGRRESSSASSGAALWLDSQQQQAQSEGDRQLQLLRSANVELSRRSQRLQRDAVVASTAGSDSNQPGCGYPGSPAHASVTFNTSQVVAGTAASYTCDNGYELLGPPRRICQSNGTWSPVGIPFCGK